jgi:hypothetical protein
MLLYKSRANKREHNMAKVHHFTQPVDLSKESIGNYYMNLYNAKTGEFVEGRHYEMFSGTAMMEEARDLRQCGYTVEW